MNIMEHVFIADAMQANSAGRLRSTWHEHMPTVPVRYRRGGRCGTLRMSLFDFAKRMGNPHEAAPVEDWRNYEQPLLDGAGKVSAVWFFATPRGLVQVSDYWWNKSDELSIRATDARAMIWFRRWCREKELPIE